MAENNHVQFIVAVGGFVYRDGRYLVIERGPKEWAAGALCSPGGGVEVADQSIELLEDEVRREVLEETGVTVGNEIVYAFSKAFTGGSGVPILSIYFLCQYGHGEAHIADPDEVASVEWLTAEQILSDPRSLDWMIHDLRSVEQVRQRYVAMGSKTFK